MSSNHPNDDGLRDEIVTADLQGEQDVQDRRPANGRRSPPLTSRLLCLLLLSRLLRWLCDCWIFPLFLSQLLHRLCDFCGVLSSHDILLRDLRDVLAVPPPTPIGHSVPAAAQSVHDNFEIMVNIFTYLPIKEQAKNKLVCKSWLALNTQSIDESPKKAFETTKELRKAVLHYCNEGGDYDYRNQDWDKPQVPPPTRAQQEMVAHVYGAVINNWNVSKITDFSFIFLRCKFNEDISAWNTSNATTMMGMFEEASRFNQPLNSWDTSNVENMTCMFDCAGSFNQPLNKWKTHNVKIMRFMFNRARSFNQPLNGWDTSSVEDMQCMFNEAEAFNQPLNEWNTSNVERMIYMFCDALSFNQPLSKWNTSKVKTMHSMFEGATSFNQPIDMWDTSSITHPFHMP